VKASTTFRLGLAIFILAKLYLILIPTIFGAGPRLGDDALSYLWKGKLAALGYASSSPANDDLRAQQHLPDDAPPETQFARSRVMAFVSGTYSPSYDLVSRAALATTSSLKWAFAFTEIVVLLAMALGFSWFLKELLGEAATGVALMLLAFAILPNQGIFAFIPSTAALSLSMVVWAYLLRSGVDAKALPVFLASLFILGVHPVAKIYLLVAIPIHAIGLGGIGEMFRPRHWRLYAAIVLAIVVALVVTHMYPVFDPSQPGNRGGINFADGIIKNLQAAWPLLADPVTRKNLLLVVLFGLATTSPAKYFPEKKIRSMLFLLGMLLLVSFLFYLPGYPAELFSRTLVPFMVLAAGIAARAALMQIQQPRFRKLALSLLGLGLAISLLLWIDSYVFQTMNWRTEVINDALLERQLRQLPEHSTIVYAESGIGLQASLLKGGGHFGALVYPMLAHTQSLDRLIAQRKPSAIVVPAPAALNSLAENRAKILLPRRHGLYFGIVDRIRILDSGSPGSDIYLLVDNPGKPFALPVTVIDSQRGETVLGREIPIPSGKQWLRILTGLPSSGWVATFVPPRNAAWIMGMAKEPPDALVNWPWRSNLKVTYHFSGDPETKLASLDFSAKGLLEDYGADSLLPYVNKTAPVLSDDSGLVFLRTSFQAAVK